MAGHELGTRQHLERAGITPLSVPTPFAVGPVNVFLIEDEPLTLVDAGPASIQARDILEYELRQRGYGLGDLERLLVTHQHTDHLGLIAHLAAASGAEVICLKELADYADPFEVAAREDDDFAASLMSMHGVPEDTVTVLRSVAALTRKWGTSFATTRRLEPHDVIEFRNRQLRVVHAPGHSPTDTLFVDDDRRIAFVGDHLLADISSNALMSPDRTVSHRPYFRRHALREYEASLRATRELDLAIVASGHGRLVRDHRALIDMRLRQRETRSAEIVAILRSATRSAHGIAEAMWGRVAIAQAYLTLSEVLGHLDMLAADGAVAEIIDDAGLVSYRAIDD